MHRLAAASEQAEGITFTDKNGNFITENDQEDKNATDYAHIPVINNDNGEHMSFNREEMGNEGNDQAIIGVDEQDNVTNNNVLEETITGVNKQDNMTSNNVSEQNAGVEENEHEKIGALLEEENDPDEYLTLGDINIRLEMNASNREST